jgi:hypothetical protein
VWDKAGQEGAARYWKIARRAGKKSKTKRLLEEKQDRRLFTL